MKTKRIILLIAVLSFVCALCCACNGQLKSVNDAQKAAVEKLTKLECTATVTDGAVTVYKYKKVVSVTDGAVSAMTVESKLNSSFVLEDKTTSEDLPLNRAAFKTVNFDKNVVTFVSEDENGMVFEVSKENLSAFLGSTVESSDKATVKVTVVDGGLEKISVIFSTASAKTVTIEFKYSY